MESTYHVIQINGEGRKAKVTAGGMTADAANEKAAELRGRRQPGSSIDYRIHRDGTRMR